MITTSCFLISTPQTESSLLNTVASISQVNSVFTELLNSHCNGELQAFVLIKHRIEQHNNRLFYAILGFPL